MAGTPVKAERLMHLDGCHFFVWVSRLEDGRVMLSFDERRGSDLSMHARFDREEWVEDGERKSDGPCPRCLALRNGADPRSVTREIADFPSEARESFFHVLGVVGEIEEASA